MKEFNFINETFSYDEDIEVLDSLNKSIDSLYYLSVNTVGVDKRVVADCGDLAGDLEEQRNRRFGDLINWNEVYRYFKLKEDNKKGR